MQAERVNHENVASHAITQGILGQIQEDFFSWVQVSDRSGLFLHIYQISWNVWTTHTQFDLPVL